MHCKLSHPIFPSCKPDREQPDTDSSPAHTPKGGMVDVELSICHGWTGSTNSSYTSSLSALNPSLSLSVSQRLVDK